MNFTVEIPNMEEAIAKAVAIHWTDKQAELQNWKYFTLVETAKLLQVKTSTILDKRQPYLTELEYSQNGKIFWFNKKSVEEYISNRSIKKYIR